MLGKRKAKPEPRPGVLTAGSFERIEFDGTFVTIRKPNMGEKRIPLRQIQAVQWKPSGRLLEGWIEFTVSGSIERHGRDALEQARLVRETRTRS